MITYKSSINHYYAFIHESIFLLLNQQYTVYAVVSKWACPNRVTVIFQGQTRSSLEMHAQWYCLDLPARALKGG